jgi:hypothetical protein
VVLSKDLGISKAYWWTIVGHEWRLRYLVGVVGAFVIIVGRVGSGASRDSRRLYFVFTNLFFSFKPPERAELSK